MKMMPGILCLWTAGLVATPISVQAHEEGAPFSGAIIDPPILHHAHIENEQRINLFSFRGFEDAGGRKRAAFEGELELAYGSPNFRYGFEAFVPVSSLPSPEDGRRATGLGDIELRPLKYALVMKPDFVVSTASAFALPTGSERDGLGEGKTSFTQFLFLDKAVGNWGLGVNLGLGTTLWGENQTTFEHGVGLSYSFIRGVKFGELAPARPEQKWVVAPSVEYVGDRGLRGELAGQDTTSIIPAVTLWHVRSGWQIRFGVQVPVSGQREADQVFLIQFGNHLNWKRLLGVKAEPPGRE